MISKFRNLALSAAAMAVFSSSLLAQVVTLQGAVKGPDGKPLPNAVINILRQDMKGTYKTKTNKKGEWVHAGIPTGKYNFEVEVDGQVKDRLQGYTLNFQTADRPINFDLAAIAEKQQAMQQAAATGQLTEEQAKSMSKEEREALEKQMKEREKQLKANKELNDAFNAGRKAMEEKNYPAAIEALNKAATLDEKQVAIWGSLGDAYVGLAKTQSGQEKTDSQTKAIESYGKSIAIQPDAATYNQLGLLYGEMKKFDDMKNQFFKAAELDTANAGKYYFNIGAVCTNNGAVDCAKEAFEKVPEGDAKYADARYQLGIILMAQAQTKADGTITPAPGTVEAFQKYLELAPDGPNAETAKQMITMMGGKIEQSYQDPNAKVAKPKPGAKKPKP